MHPFDSPQSKVFNLKKVEEWGKECSSDIVVCSSKGSKCGSISGCLGPIGRYPWSKKIKVWWSMFGTFRCN